jgi:small subunit ribosomal protein S16
MVVIRLARGGSHNRPYYYVVVADSRCPRDGRFIEKLGFYNPLIKAQADSCRISAERLEYWINVGAQMSPTVKNLVKKHKILAVSPTTAV